MADEERALENLFADIPSKRKLLFVGQADNSEGLKRLMELPWQIIFTSRFSRGSGKGNGKASYEDLLEIIHEKKGKEIYRLPKLSDKIDTKHDLILIQISKEKQNDSRFGKKTDFDFEYKNILKKYLKDQQNDLVIYGFSEEMDAGSELYEAIESIIQDSTVSGNITFIDSDICSDNREALESLGVTVFTEPYLEMLEEYGYDYDEDSDGSELDDEQNKKDFFYSNQKRVWIDRAKIPGKLSQIEILTDGFVYHEDPKGRLAMKDAFEKYLCPERYAFPKWYGYFEDKGFYIPRAADDKLYKKVIKALEKGTDAPIILCGAPSCGKTVTAGALAYRIYKEHQYPVVFIRADDKGEPAAENLNKFLLYLKTKSEDEQPVLIIWDLSSVNQGKKEIKDAADDLQCALRDNCGRRFVLLCTAYEYEKVAERNMITLDRSLKDEEKTAFLDKLGELEENLRKLRIEEGGEIKRIIDKYRSESDLDIAIMFYDMKTEFVSFFAEGLQIEQTVMADYIFDKLNAQRTRVFDRLIQLYMAETRTKYNDEEAQKETIDSEIRLQLEEFNLCIALFGLADLKAPSSLALSFFPGINLQGISYIPWIQQKYLDDSYEAFFCFRNNLEAELFVSNYFSQDDKSGREAEIIFSMIERIIDFFIEDRAEHPSYFLKKSTIDFLRCYGPNTDKTGKFCAYSKYKITPKDFKDLKQLIDPIGPLIKNGADEDGDFAIIYVNYCHEFFQKELNRINKINDSIHKDDTAKDDTAKDDAAKDDTAKIDTDELETYMKFLQDIIELCKNSIAGLEEKIGKETYNKNRKHYLTTERTSLVTEMVICDSQLKDFRRIYIQNCGDKLSEDNHWMNGLSTMNFGEVFDLLSDLIKRDRENEYCYNTLLRSFKAYLKSDNKTDTNYRFRVGELIDIGEIYLPPLPDARGFHTNVAEFNDDFRSSLRLDDIKDRKDLSEILYACRCELKNGNVDRVFSYLDGPERDDEIRKRLTKDDYTNVFRLRVAWKHFTGLELFSNDECRCIALTKDQWRLINRICTDYFKCTDPKQQKATARDPYVLLVYALSELYLDKSCEETARFIKDNIRDDMFYNRYKKMRTPFMICEFRKGDDDDAVTRKYWGRITFKPADNNTGKVEITSAGIECRCNCWNIGENHLPDEGTELSGLELGLGFTGFSAYTKEGRENKKAKAGQKKGKGR